MNWSREHKYYTDNGPYRICWTDARPPLFMCSHKKQFIGKSYNIDEAKEICKKYKGNL